jgi:hypothetical protein
MERLLSGESVWVTGSLGCIGKDMSWQRNRRTSRVQLRPLIKAREGPYTGRVDVLRFRDDYDLFLVRLVTVILSFMRRTPWVATTTFIQWQKHGRYRKLIQHCLGSQQNLSLP